MKKSFYFLSGDGVGGVVGQSNGKPNCKSNGQSKGQTKRSGSGDGDLLASEPTNCCDDATSNRDNSNLLIMVLLE